MGELYHRAGRPSVLNAQIVVLGGCANVFSGGAWAQAVVNTVASLTAMIPLGLVLMTSIAFAVGASRLARRQVLVNELPAVGGLARADVVCLDKTGTLTVGEIGFDQAHRLPGLIAEREETVAAALAWYAASPDAGATARSMRTAYPVVAPLIVTGYIPFSSARNWSAVSFAESTGTWVMGAPEIGLRRWREASAGSSTVRWVLRDRENSPRSRCEFPVRGVGFSVLIDVGGAVRR